jgi:hypothetical protein
MALITYADKQTLNVNPSVPDVNKVNASDMNQIKTGINTNETNIANLTNVVPDSLYTNASGSNGTITLSSSAANYSYIEIFFGSGSGGYGSVKVADPNTKNVPLVIFWTGVYTSSYQAVYMDTRTVAINGTSISTLDTRYYHQAIKYNGTLGEYSHDNNIYITKVLGYK